MKTWTVMLIPHDRTSTRTFTLATWHGFALLTVLSILSFATAFFFQRQQVMAEHMQTLQDSNRALQFQAASPEQALPVTVAATTGQATDERLRAEYEASLTKITSELNALYDMEAKARELTGLAPRAEMAEEEAGNGEGGMGGAPGGTGGTMLAAVDERLRPPHVIYGMAKPSADLILQEIHLRRQSLEALVKDVATDRDRVERLPSIWPVLNGAGKITSRYGYRRDPFNRRVRHHDGMDISAPTGTKVVATAKGKVKDSYYDKYLGNLICIEHGNGLETWYAHLSKRLVEAGEIVERGAIIGHVGSTGRSTGAHLHYEVHERGKAINPSRYVSD